MSALTTKEELIVLAYKYADAHEVFDKEWDFNRTEACGEPFFDAEQALEKLQDAWVDFVRCKPREFAEMLERGVNDHG